MLTKEQNEIWDDVVKRIFDALNDLGKKLKPEPAIRAACLTEIVMPMYDYIINVSDKQHFDKLYQIYLAAIKEQEGNLDS